MTKEVYAEEINGKLVEVDGYGSGVMVKIVEIGELIPNVKEVSYYNYDGLRAHVSLSHWYEPEKRYHTEIADCKAQFASPAACAPCAPQSTQSRTG